MNKLMFTAAVLAAMFGSAGLAIAQGMGPYGGMYHHGGRGMGPQFHGLVDQNGNGTIEADEAAADAQNHFDEADVNGDDQLSKDEFMASHLRFGAGHGHRHQVLEEQAEKRFKAMDKNNDGNVDQDEYMDFSQQQFAAADKNKDGKVDPWEYRRVHPHHY